MDDRENKTNNLSNWKNFAVLILVISLVVLVFIFFETKTFERGSKVDEQTFIELFSQSQKVIVLMDVRGVTDPIIKKNIFQCGVDFASSSGLVTKNVTYYSLGEVGCVTPEGEKNFDYCFNEIKKSMTIHIEKGDKTEYYQNSLVVGINSVYDVPCGIHSK